MFIKVSGYFRRSIYSKTYLVFEHVPDKCNTHKICKYRFKKDPKTLIFVAYKYKSRKISQGKLDPTEEIKNTS